ncbi:MAG: aldehyde dehydrogenase [Blastocatellia bacterium AA13]|nr:MAG: aldehyde dehydrogenase [Blastocatellia bacterium AA13]
MDNDSIVGILNELVETCRDGQEGFKEASDNVTTQDLKNFFLEMSRERAQFLGELQNQVRGYGSDPDNTGSTAGALHRAWMSIKGTLTGQDDKAILAEVERGEDSAVKAYEHALKERLPISCRPMVERQYLAIKTAHDHIKLMRDSRSVKAGR